MRKLMTISLLAGLFVLVMSISVSAGPNCIKQGQICMQKLSVLANNLKKAEERCAANPTAACQRNVERLKEKINKEEKACQAKMDTCRQ